MLRQRIAVLTDWPFSSVYHEGLERGIDSYACAQGFEVIHFAVGSFNSQRQLDSIRERLFELISPQAFAGIIILTPTMCNLGSRARLAEVVAKLKALPMLGLADSLCGEPYLKTSSGPGFGNLLRHLIYEHGYRRFCYISGPYGNREAEERLFLYRQTLAESGIKSDPLNEYVGGFVFADGREAVRVFWDERRLRPEVIVCANDGMALGVWQELKERGLSVPYDVALTGFDEIRLSDHFSLNLTTVRQPIYEEGVILAQAIQALIDDKALPSLEPLPTEEVIRHSCGCNKAGRKDFLALRSGMLPKVSKAFDASLAGFDKALNLNMPKTELLKLWARLVLQGVKEQIEQEALLETVAKIRQGVWSCSLKGIKPSLQELNELAEEMLEILLDIYAQSDLIGKHERSEITEAMRWFFENLEQESLQATRLEELLPQLRQVFKRVKANCAYVVLSEDSKRPFGDARLVLGCGHLCQNPVPEEGFRFVAHEIIPPYFSPASASSLVLELLYVGERILGYLLMDVWATGANVFEACRSRISSLLASLNYRRKLAETNERLCQALTLLETISITDELTGLYNRRGFMILATQQLNYLLRKQERFFILYADLDKLKKINDQYGHLEGDEALKSVAWLFKNCLRSSDVIARMGGDEFVALIGGAEKADFAIIKERLERACAKLNLTSARPYRISLSLGFYCPKEPFKESLTEMLARADQVLYEEKRRHKER